MIHNASFCLLQVYADDVNYSIVTCNVVYESVGVIIAQSTVHACCSLLDLRCTVWFAVDLNV